MSFAYYDPANIEFGVCRGPLSAGDCVLIPVDDDVKQLLQQMMIDTRTGIGLDDPGTTVPRFEPSQEYGPASRVALPLTSRMAAQLRAFYERENLPIDPDALKEPQAVSAYFCVMHDHEDNKLVAIKRASQFKAILKAHLLRLIDDGLRAVTDNVFKLDADFDLLIMDGKVQVLRVAAFEQLADIDEQVQAAAVENTKKLEEQVPSIGFASVVDYVVAHKRAARIVAALAARADLAETSVTNLRRECQRNGVAVKTLNGKLCPDPGNELAFLQMLDRRRYSISLVAGRWEQYEAGSRKELSVRERQTDGPAVRVKKVQRAKG